MLVAIDISLVAWLAENYSTAATVLRLMTAAVILAVSFAIAWVYASVYRIIRRLEEV